jgi:hypothetical protein
MLGDAHETLEAVDMTQLLARSALKDGSGGGESASYGVDAAFMLFCPTACLTLG